MISYVSFFADAKVVKKSGKKGKKKAIFPDSQSFVNLKSNTMKNTLQR